MLRFTKLDDKQVLSRIVQIIEKEKIDYENDGLEALVFTADGIAVYYR